MWSVEALQQTTVLKEVPKGVRIVCGRRGTRFVTHPFCDCRPRCSLLTPLPALGVPIARCPPLRLQRGNGCSGETVESDRVACYPGRDF